MKGINVVSNVAERANTASTTHFVALWDHVRNGSIRSGENIVFGVSGSGMTMGAALYTLDDLPDRLLSNAPANARTHVNGSHRKSRARAAARTPRISLESVGLAPEAPTGLPHAVEMATAAARNCLAGSSHSIADVGLLVYAGVYRNEYVSEPALASMLAGALGLNRDASHDTKKALALDLFNGAIGFLHACYVAIQAIRFGSLKAALVAAAEIENNRGFPAPRWYGLRETGSAVMLSAAGDGRSGFGRFVFHSATDHVDALQAHTIDDEQHGYLDVVRSRDLDAQSVAAIKHAVDELLAAEGLSLADIQVVLPPQKSPEFLGLLADQLQIPPGKLVDVTTPGQDLFTSSLAYAFHEVKKQGRCRAGDLGLILAAGSGIQAAAALYYF
jgi:3-oxoacyl-[acyl-carrier-protein] synthase III